jgi:hypothetical protein
LVQHGCSVAAEVRQIDTNGEGKGIEAPSNNAQVFAVNDVGTLLADSDGIEQEILVCNLYSYDGDIAGTTNIAVRAANKNTRAVGDKIIGIMPEGGTGLIWADSGTEVLWTEAGTKSSGLPPGTGRGKALFIVDDLDPGTPDWDIWRF